MLYFSLTVWVLTPSSSLPALEGALESSNGEMKGPTLLSRLRSELDDHEVRLLLKPLASGDGGIGESSRNLRGPFRGGRRSSVESAGEAVVYTGPAFRWLFEGAVLGLDCCVKERDVFDREFCGLCCGIDWFCEA
jgi:hypothetical protein